MALDQRIIDAIGQFKNVLIYDFPVERDKLIAKAKEHQLLENYLHPYISSDKNNGLYRSIIDLFNSMHNEAFFQMLLEFFKVSDRYEVWVRRNKGDGTLLYRFVDKTNEKNYFVIIYFGCSIVDEQFFEREFRFYDFQAYENIYFVFGGKIETATLMSLEGIKPRNDDHLQQVLEGYKVTDLLKFLKSFFNNETRKAVLNAMNSVQKSVDDLIGYSVTEICSHESLERFKEQKIADWKHYDYKALVGDTIIYPTKINNLINKFVAQERYRILFDGNLYSESYITSEWFYQKYANKIRVTNFDMTAVVAGYFKSVEQLLDDFIFRHGKNRSFPCKEKERYKVGSINYQSMLGGMRIFLSENDDLFEEKDTYLQMFYKKKLGTWIDNCRNGFFHKDNINDSNTLALIRQETLSLYFFTLVMYRFDD